MVSKLNCWCPLFVFFVYGFVFVWLSLDKYVEYCLKAETFSQDEADLFFTSNLQQIDLSKHEIMAIPFDYKKDYLLNKHLFEIIDHFIENGNYYGDVTQNKQSLIENKTTILIMSYENNLFDLLKLIEFYCLDLELVEISLIYEIIVVWNSKNNTFYDNLVKAEIINIQNKKHDLNLCNKQLEIEKVDKYININFINAKTNSLSNRWMVSDIFKTVSVTISDDDFIISKKYLNSLLNVFRTLNKQNDTKIIVSLKRRFFVHNKKKDHRHNFDVIKKKLKFNQIFFGYKYYRKLNYQFFYSYQQGMDARHNPLKFNMGLPTSMVLPTYLFKYIQYTFRLYKLQTIIDQQSAHCDDIALCITVNYLFQNKKVLAYYNASASNELSNLMDIDLFNHGTDIDLFSHNVSKLQKKTDKRLTQQPYRSLYRTECLNLIINHFKTIDFIRKKWPFTLNVTEYTTDDYFN